MSPRLAPLRYLENSVCCHELLGFHRWLQIWITWRAIIKFPWNFYQLVYGRTWVPVFFKAPQMILRYSQVWVPIRQWFSNFRWNKNQLWGVLGTRVRAPRVSRSGWSLGICWLDLQLQRVWDSPAAPLGVWTLSAAATWRCPAHPLPKPGHCPKKQKPWERPGSLKQRLQLFTSTSLSI